MRVLFLYLTSFSTYGGIEKFNKALMKALSENEAVTFKALSSHDRSCDTRYISDDNFRGFSGNKVKFSFNAISEAGNCDIIILGHINLAPVGILLKRLYPEKKIILITHGIEVWNKLSPLKKQLLHNMDEIIAVSNFTKSKLIKEHCINSDKIEVLYNTIDPYFEYAHDSIKPGFLKQRYQVDDDSKVILTVCRISSGEKYKGYDKVIDALPETIKIFPKTKYLLVGKYDEVEKKRILEKVGKLKLKNNVILTGFVPEDELLSHYLLADVFAMPSSGEGFGIVFLEAIACGLPVITGNNDGSKEIIEKLKFGISINPDNNKELSSAIISFLMRKRRENGKDESIKKIFGFERYKKTLIKILRLDQKEFVVA